jgi:hypothetical protein
VPQDRNWLAQLNFKPDCGLCDRARAVLRPFEQTGRLRVEPVDISSSPELFRRYCFSIPVLALATGEQLSWPFNRADVERLLTSLSADARR